jgi:DNA-binding HxlR family transcriptional regulator
MKASATHATAGARARLGLEHRLEIPMQRKSFGHMQCPIARALERVGEWWSILILRDAFYGMTRFDEFQKSLDIAPNMLTRRLNALVEAELLERRRYSEKPPRYEYVLTERGRGFRPVLWALLEWGSDNFSPEGRCIELVDRKTGKAAKPVLVDSRTGKPMNGEDFMPRAGPAASEGIRKRLAFAGEKRRDPDLKPDFAPDGKVAA